MRSGGTLGTRNRSTGLPGAVKTMRNEMSATPRRMGIAWRLRRTT
jgi:hypothetical protein